MAYTCRPLQAHAMRTAEPRDPATRTASHAWACVVRQPVAVAGEWQSIVERFKQGHELEK
eukprot:315290-Chlamydomonas_euryale.AAC.8